MRWSSVSGKVFIAFLAVMATFGGVTAYGALAMRRLGDELRRVSRGYLTLRLDLHDLQSRQSNLFQEMERSDEESQRSPGIVKGGVDLARVDRKKQVKRLSELTGRLLDEATSADEAAFLSYVRERLGAIEQQFADDEPLFDRVYGPPFARMRTTLAPSEWAQARDQLLKREEKVWQKDIKNLTNDLRARVSKAEEQLERDERRAAFLTIALAVLAALIGLGMMALVQRALAPLRRLAAGAQQLARGDWRHRVAVASTDEIGALGREFNAMAAALEEREVRLIRSERLAAIG